MLQLHGPPGRINSLSFAPDGRTLAAAGIDSQCIWLWDLGTGRLRRSIDAGKVRQLLHDGSRPQRLYSVDHRGQVCVAEDDQPLTRVLQLCAGVGWLPEQRIALSSDGRLLASNLGGAKGNTAPWLYAAIWDITAGHEVHRFTENRSVLSSLAISPDDRWLALGSFDRTVHVLDLQSFQLARRLLHGDKVHHVAISSDGTTLASASPGGLVKLWDFPDGGKRCTLRGQGKFLRAITFSADGQTLATASGDGLVRLWHTPDGRLRTILDWRIGAIHSIAFAPDGLRAAAGGTGWIVVWDVEG